MSGSKKRPVPRLKEDAETTSRIMLKMTSAGADAVTAETKVIGKISAQNVNSAVALRTKQTAAAANVRHAPDREAKDRVLAEFKSKRWPSMSAAAHNIHTRFQRELGESFQYEFETVYRWIRDSRRKNSM